MTHIKPTPVQIWERADAAKTRAICLARIAIEEERKARTALHEYLRISAGIRITTREAEVLVLVREGLSNKMIAARLNISPRTVKFHVSSLLFKADANNRQDLRDDIYGLGA